MKKRQKRGTPSKETTPGDRVHSAIEPALPVPIGQQMRQENTFETVGEPGSPDQVELLRKILLQDLEEEEEEGTEVALPAEEELQALLFRLSGESYALDISEVEQIIRYTEPAEVPHTVDFLEGIVGFRGKMVPVINGRKRMGRDPATPDRKSRIIIVRDHQEFIGILVDAVLQVIRLPQSSIQPTPPVIPGENAEFMDGVAGYQGKMVILLNTKRFLQMR